MATPAAQPRRLPAGITAGERALDEARENTRAVIQVIDAVGREVTTADILQSSLRAVKCAFNLDYGACWMIDQALQATSFRTEVGNLGAAYDRINQTDHYVRGKGLTGRTWEAADVIFIPELEVIKDSELVRTARAAGAVSAVSTPFIVEEKVAGVLFFFSFQRIYPSKERLDALRNIGRLVGQAFSRLLDLERARADREALRVGAEEILCIVRAAQEGDLTRAMPRCQDTSMNQVAEGLGSFLAGFRDSLSRILQTAHSLASAAENLKRMSTGMEGRAAETSSNAATATTASTEVSLNIRSIAAGSEEMIASIHALSENANEAAQKFQTAVSVAGSAQKMIGALSASSVDIATIVMLVETIARQTNMLALNAAIEAARAGPAGRAFMVVANEVKELARESSAATKRISEKIGSMQQETEHAVSAIAQITTIVEEVGRISESIAGTIREQSATTTAIGRNVEDAAQGSLSIARKIGELASEASGSQRGALETQEAACALTAMAAELHTLVSRFKVA